VRAVVAYSVVCRVVESVNGIKGDSSMNRQGVGSPGATVREGSSNIQLLVLVVDEILPAKVNLDE